MTAQLAKQQPFRRPIIWLRSLILTGFLFVQVLPAHAEESVSQNQLKGVETELEQERKNSQELGQKSKILKEELQALLTQLVKTAKAVQDHEHVVQVLEEQLVILVREEAEKSSRLQEKRTQFIQVLAALERMALVPSEAIIAQPGKPVDTVRSALLLRSVVPEIEKRAKILRRQIEELATAREALNQQQEALHSESELLALENSRLGGLLARKKLLKEITDDDQQQAKKRAKKLASQAKDIRDLMERLVAERTMTEASVSLMAQELPPQKPSGAASDVENAETQNNTQVAVLAPVIKSGSVLTGILISKQKGSLAFPAVGKIAGKYGGTNENGMTRRGIEIKTRPAAQVIAPFEGTVAFVGEFRGYGQLLIIEHSEDYHSLLAGMSRIDSVMGQRILMGEPVGIMNPEQNKRPMLYLELRHNGRPVNPLPWLGPRRNNTQG